jgi:hypothetical protein
MKTKSFTRATADHEFVGVRSRRYSIGFTSVLATLAVTLLATSTQSAAQERVLHRFNNNGTDRYQPSAGLVFDSAGNLYGTTYLGGTSDCGTPFELSPVAGGGWNETILYNFCSQPADMDGAGPSAAVVFDGAGNLYGTTQGGGSCQGECSPSGTVFVLSPPSEPQYSWGESVLYSFGVPYGAEVPSGGVVFDGTGNLWGTNPMAAAIIGVRFTS